MDHTFAFHALQGPHVEADTINLHEGRIGARGEWVLKAIVQAKVQAQQAKNAFFLLVLSLCKLPRELRCPVHALAGGQPTCARGKEYAYGLVERLEGPLAW